MEVTHEGDKITSEAAQPCGNEYFIEQARVQPIIGAAEGLDIVVVRFSPGARTFLHSHDVVQVLHCIEGTGILATEGERNRVTPGMVVHVPAGELHWHGATEGSSFVHLSIRPPGESRWTKIDPLAPLWAAKAARPLAAGSSRICRGRLLPDVNPTMVTIH